VAALLRAIRMTGRLQSHREIPYVRCENDGRRADSVLECRVSGIRKAEGTFSDHCTIQELILGRLEIPGVCFCLPLEDAWHGHC
jgi:hypothetical protein